MNNDERELKPCPFCGGRAKVDNGGLNYEYYWAKCTKCGTEQPLSNTVDAAAANWNRRHGDDRRCGECGNFNKGDGTLHRCKNVRECINEDDAACDLFEQKIGRRIRTENETFYAVEWQSTREHHGGWYFVRDRYDEIIKCDTAEEAMKLKRTEKAKDYAFGFSNEYRIVKMVETITKEVVQCEDD